MLFYLILDTLLPYFKSMRRVNIYLLIGLSCYLFNLTSCQSKEEKAKEALSSLPETWITDSGQKVDPENLDEQYLINLIVSEINVLRSGLKLSALTPNAVLRAAAVHQNNYQANRGRLGHHQDDYTMETAKDRVKNLGGDMRYIEENIQYFTFNTIFTEGGDAVKSATLTYLDVANKMIESWINSYGAKKHLRNPRLKYVGTAIKWHPEKKALFVTQVYGG